MSLRLPLRCLGLLLLAALVLAASPLPAHSGGPSAREPHSRTASLPAAAGLRAALARLPISFEPNRGQTAPAVRFLSRGRGYSLFLTATGAVLSLAAPEHETGGRRPGQYGSMEVWEYGSGLDSHTPILPHSHTSTVDRHTSANAAVHPAAPAILRMELLGADGKARVRGVDAQPGRVNYLTGNDPGRWLTGLPLYSRVLYEGIYPGIDLVYYGTGCRLEYDFVVRPGADPARIRLRFEGAERVALQPGGDLLLRTRDGTVRQHRPLVYQWVNGRKRPVSARYVLLPPEKYGSVGVWEYGSRTRSAPPMVVGPAGTKTPSKIGALATIGTPPSRVPAKRVAGLGGHTPILPYSHTPIRTRPVDSPTKSVTLAFKVGDYDRSRPLVVDPPLSFSTLLGGSDDDQAFGIAADANGNAYVTGSTLSADFPSTTGVFQESSNGNADAFVAKLDPAAGTLVYATYLGGSGDDLGRSIAVDSAGNAYVTGATASRDFPTAGPLQATLRGSTDAFVAELDPIGSSLVYSTYLGGTGSENADENAGIAVDSSGSAYITGQTTSTDFPTVNPVQPALRGGIDAFVAKIQPEGTALAYSTYLGGTDDDGGTGIAVDGAGSAYVTGWTASTDFPTAQPLQPASAGATDAFVTKLQPDGATFAYSTYLGGSDAENFLPGAFLSGGIAVDSSGNAYVTGATLSSDFPRVNAVQAVRGGDLDAFVSEINADGSAFVFSTYLGGSLDDAGMAITVDSNGSAAVAGFTASTDFPTANAVQKTAGGGGDAFLARLKAGGAGLALSTYLGGSDIDVGTGVAVDPSGNVYLAGETQSVDFPTVSAPQEFAGGGWDAFVAKVAGSTSPPPPRPPAAPSDLLAFATELTEVTLRWLDNSTNETGFKIERSLDGRTFALLATVGANVERFTDRRVSAGGTYYYRVKAFNAAGDSAPSNVAVAHVPSTQIFPPSNLAVSPVSDTQLRLTWKDNSDNEAGFRIERSEDGGKTFHEIGTTGANVTTFLDQGLKPATRYVYRVRAFNSIAISPYSNQAGGTTLLPPPATQLLAVPFSSTEIRLSWRDTTTGETGYRIERKTDEQSFVVLATVPAGTTTYSDRGLKPNTTYTYRFKVLFAGGESAFSNEAAALTLPATPERLEAKALSPTEIRLSWDQPGGAEGYRIERRSATASFQQIASVAAGTSVFVDTGLFGGTTYTYRVRAFNRSGVTSPSNEATATTTTGVATLTLRPAEVRGGRPSLGTLTLTNPAPHGGVLVRLFSDRPKVVSLPASLRVPQGKSTASFRIRTRSVRKTVRVTVGAGAGAVSATATLTVRR